MSALSGSTVVSPRPLPAYATAFDLPIVTIGATDPHTGAMAAPVFGAGEVLARALALSALVIRRTPGSTANASRVLVKPPP